MTKKVTAHILAVPEDSDMRTLTLIFDGKVYTINDKSNMYFDLILEGLPYEQDVDSFRSLLEPSEVIEEFSQLSTTEEQDEEFVVEFLNDTIYVNKVPMWNSLVERILDFKKQGVPYDNLIAFLKRILKNPTAHSREQLFQFLERFQVPITEKGTFVAYKGVQDDYLSHNAGYGIVNGVEFTESKLANHIGNVIEMPRHMVTHDPKVHCSHGLHCGALSYVRQYFPNGRIVLVEVDPMDVVSVPEDCDFTKIRVCKYSVIAEFNEELKTLTYGDTPQKVKSPIVTVKPSDPPTFDFDDTDDVKSGKNVLFELGETITVFHEILLEYLSMYKSPKSRVKVTDYIVGYHEQTPLEFIVSNQVMYSVNLTINKTEKDLIEYFRSLLNNVSGIGDKYFDKEQLFVYDLQKIVNSLDLVLKDE